MFCICLIKTEIKAPMHLSSFFNFSWCAKWVISLQNCSCGILLPFTRFVRKEWIL